MDLIRFLLQRPVRLFFVIVLVFALVGSVIAAGSQLSGAAAASDTSIYSADTWTRIQTFVNAAS